MPGQFLPRVIATFRDDDWRGCHGGMWNGLEIGSWMETKRCRCRCDLKCLLIRSRRRTGWWDSPGGINPLTQRTELACHRLAEDPARAAGPGRSHPNCGNADRCRRITSHNRTSTWLDLLFPDSSKLKRNREVSRMGGISVRRCARQEGRWRTGGSLQIAERNQMKMAL